MATEANKPGGAFLIAGFLPSTRAGWIGTSRILEDRALGHPFRRAFTDSEQGAAVKFRGVGSVAGSIGVALDGRPVGSHGHRERVHDRAGAAGQPDQPGITGSASWSSVLRAGRPRRRAVVHAAGALYPVAAVAADEPDHGASGVAEALRGADVSGLVADYRAAAVAARKRVEAPEIDSALARVAGAADALDSLARQLAALAEDPRLDQTLERLNAAAGHIEGAARSAQPLVGDPRIPQALDDARGAAAALRLSGEQIRAEVAALRAGERLESVQRRMGGALGGVDASARARRERPGHVGRRDQGRGRLGSPCRLTSTARCSRS
jgi:hypothetical protein